MYLGYHHVAIERAFAMGYIWLLDMRSDLGDYGRSKCQVGNEVAVHDVDMDPVAAPSDAVTTASTQTGKICG